MKRDLNKLSNGAYDILIIGGGIYGACVAREASGRGLSVALVEKGDFGSGTSANSMKVVHGGLRYLQHGDLLRMRQSIMERSTLLRIAPHLVHPLPILIPTYGHGMKGREMFNLALKINDLISFDCNQGLDPGKHIPSGCVISKKDVIELIPDVNRENLSGGAIFHDAQVYNSERLIISFLRSASQAGADLSNYIEVIGFIKNKESIMGVKAKDGMTGNEFDIKAKMVINTSGPWINKIFNLLNAKVPVSGTKFVKAVNLITRPLYDKYAVGIAGSNLFNDPDTVINKGSRFFFIVPWRNRSLIGTTYGSHEGQPDQLRVTEQDIQILLDEINNICPAAQLKMDDVVFHHGGLVPVSGINLSTGDVQLSKNFKIYGEKETGLKGFLSVVGVKYTTARNVAENAINRVFQIWGKNPPKSNSSFVPVFGGEIERFKEFCDENINRRPYGLGEDSIRRLNYNYGSAYTGIFRYLESSEIQQNKVINESSILKAEVRHGIREEMAVRLSDIVFRRTELGSAGHPGSEALKDCALIMSQELGWNTSKIRQEINGVEQRFKVFS